MSYRPITDVWILARPKVKYYGAYPSGFLSRARDLLGVTVDDPVLHVCSGRVRSYPFRGLGPNDKTVDIDEQQEPDFALDVTRDPLPAGPWRAILTDPPYTEGDADHYARGRAYLPKPTDLLKRCIEALPIGCRVGILHYDWPRPPKNARSIALVGVAMGFGNRARWYSVYERIA